MTGCGTIHGRINSTRDPTTASPLPSRTILTPTSTGGCKRTSIVRSPSRSTASPAANHRLDDVTTLGERARRHHDAAVGMVASVEQRSRLPAEQRSLWRHVLAQAEREHRRAARRVDDAHDDLVRSCARPRWRRRGGDRGAFRRRHLGSWLGGNIGDRGDCEPARQRLRLVNRPTAAGPRRPDRQRGDRQDTDRHHTLRHRSHRHGSCDAGRGRGQFPRVEPERERERAAPIAAVAVRAFAQQLQPALQPRLDRPHRLTGRFGDRGRRELLHVAGEQRAAIRLGQGRDPLGQLSERVDRRGSRGLERALARGGRLVPSPHRVGATPLAGDTAHDRAQPSQHGTGLPRRRSHRLDRDVLQHVVGASGTDEIARQPPQCGGVLL
jgi:hypothetical protein